MFFAYEIYRVDEKTYSEVLSDGITTKPSNLPAGYSVAEYKSEDGQTKYYYPYSTADVSNDRTDENYRLSGKITGALVNDEGYINETTNAKGEKIADGTKQADRRTFHERNYSLESGGTYERVNQYAEPIYWQAKHLPIAGQVTDGVFVDYYVLKITWDSSFTNNKETDMIYITARKSIN